MKHSDWLFVGERLRYQRMRLGYTQEYMAEKMGISLRYYQMIERGEKGMSVNTLEKLHNVFSISCDYLLFNDQDAPSDFRAILDQLTPEQRKDAMELLLIYFRGCNSSRCEK